MSKPAYGRYVSGWEDVGPDVFRKRYEPWDVSVCVVRGDDGLLVVDTRASYREADEIRSDLRIFGNRPVRWVVNTHAHFDHTFGNARFGRGSDVAAVIYGHERVPAHLEEFERPLLAEWLAAGREDAREVIITAPDVLVTDHCSVDVGGREVVLRHLGRGHTDNDIVVHVPDAETWLVGDLVEESGPPMYGSGSYPLDWPVTLGRLLDAVGRDLVVPGHGAAVDRRFIVRQQGTLRRVADLVIELFNAGVPVDDAVAAAADRWPFPSAGMADAARDGYRQLSSAGPFHRT